jgi:putative ABC transport system ATP-binding protein
MMPLAVSPLSGTDKTTMASTMLEKVDLRSKAFRLPDELSGGEQQRVAIARALVNEPSIILADEPTGNLDSTTSNEIMQLLCELNNEGRTCIIVTHNLENLQYVHRVMKLRDGMMERESIRQPQSVQVGQPQ